jgi:hypothetical protein
MRLILFIRFMFVICETMLLFVRLICVIICDFILFIICDLFYLLIFYIFSCRITERTETLNPNPLEA